MSTSMATDIPVENSTHTMTELVSGIISDSQRLLRQQVEMVKAEFKEDLRRTRQTAIALALGAVLIAVGLVLLVVSLVYLLEWLTAPSLPLWACWAIVGGSAIVAGGIALFIGARVMASFNPLPDKSFHALQENVSWIANRQS